MHNITHDDLVHTVINNLPNCLQEQFVTAASTQQVRLRPSGELPHQFVFGPFLFQRGGDNTTNTTWNSCVSDCELTRRQPRPQARYWQRLVAEREQIPAARFFQKIWWGGNLKPDEWRRLQQQMEAPGSGVRCSTTHMCVMLAGRHTSDTWWFKHSGQTDLVNLKEMSIVYSPAQISRLFWSLHRFSHLKSLNLPSCLTAAQLVHGLRQKIKLNWMCGNVFSTSSLLSQYSLSRKM